MSSICSQPHSTTFSSRLTLYHPLLCHYSATMILLNTGHGILQGSAAICSQSKCFGILTFLYSAFRNIKFDVDRVVLHGQNLEAGHHYASYTAVVVNEGVFTMPPARVFYVENPT